MDEHQAAVEEVKDGYFKKEDGELVHQHRYMSTACMHDKHEFCRKTCKFCQGPCHCYCHTQRQ